MELEFLINEDYLVAHTLYCMDKFSSEKNKKLIVDFQNYAWKVSKEMYNFVARSSYPELWLDDKSKKQTADLLDFFRKLKANPNYKQIYKQTSEYLDKCKKQWDKNFEKTYKTMSDVTGISFDKKFIVYITHPTLKNGCYLGDNKIAWGHTEEWPNYITVYLWHETLHSYFSTSKLDHAIISFLSDEFLRSKLTGDKYPPFVTHKELHPLMKKILPEWKNYLSSSNKNIFEFRDSLEKHNFYGTRSL